MSISGCQLRLIVHIIKEVKQFKVVPVLMQ